MNKLIISLILLLTSPTLFAQWINLPDNSLIGVTRAYVSSGTTLFAATDAEGIFKTTDMGASWTEANTGIGNLNIQAMSGTGSNLFAGASDGTVYRSTDEGASWAEVTTGNPDDLPVNALVVQGSTVLVGSVAGIFLSTDNGATWSQTDSSYIISLGSNGSTFFAGTYDKGAYRSTDNGLTWVKIVPEIPEPTSFGSNGSTVFVSSYSQGVLQSSDNGVTWETINGGFDEVAHPAIFVSSNNAVFVGSSGFGIYRLDNATSTWAQVDGLPAQTFIYAMAIHEDNLFTDLPFKTVRRPLSELSVEEGSEPDAFAVIPNPARSIAAIEFHLPNPVQVVVSITDVLGRTITTLANERLPAGMHTKYWNVGRRIPPGTYYIRLVTTEGKVNLRPIVVTR